MASLRFFSLLALKYISTVEQKKQVILQIDCLKTFLCDLQKYWYKETFW